jgi:type I restriction enzyme S subunit
MVPNGWEQIRLNDVTEFITSGSRDWAKFYSDCGSKFVRMTNLSRDSIYLKLDDMKYVDVSSKSADGKRTSLSAGDVLMSITAELGKIGWIPENFGEAYINQHTALIRLNDKRANSQYIAYLLSSKAMNHRINKLNDSGAKAGLNLPTIRSIYINLPPLPEQRKIAQILSTWDRGIATTEKLIETSKQQKKALMQQLLTGKKRLVNPETGKAFEGEWEKTHLKPLLIEEKSRNKDNRVTRVLSVTNHSGFVLPEEQFSKRVASDNISNYKVVKKGQFGYNPSRLNVGSFACLKQFSEGVLSPMYVVFSTDDAKLQKEYLNYWMQSNEAKQRVKNSTQGSVRESVGFDALCSFPFILPSLDEQNKIISVLSAADKEIEVLEAKLAHFKQEKKALMQQLLTGKRRVKVDEVA